MTTAPGPARFPSTRAEALARLEGFLPEAPRYAARRNFVRPPHESVSRLSPATRCRLVLETELAEAAEEAHGPGAVEKFVQEVWWRLYWKGWLEHRPEVWGRYRDELAATPWSERARAVAAGESGVAAMDAFARELAETGYLHNHARMWWAAYWVHEERLPWVLGADFFLRHLLDGDAASNTLSWRWVAGLHTRGKCYLARRSNLERHLAPEWLGARRAGLERLESPEAVALSEDELPPPRDLAASEAATAEAHEALSGEAGRCGILLHDEDLLVERSPLAALAPDALAVYRPRPMWAALGWAPGKRKHLERALDDGAARAAEHFRFDADALPRLESPQAVVAWAREARIDGVVALAPFAGPLRDEWAGLEGALPEAVCRLDLLRRPDDLAAMGRATAGFFAFWKKTEGLRTGRRMQGRDGD